jgi:hypothetical protein
MDEHGLAEARSELAALEASEKLISAERRRLHEQIDFGYASEATRAREREISDERRELHRRIDALREMLGVSDDSESDATAPESGASLLSHWTGISPEVVGRDDASAEEL